MPLVSLAGVWWPCRGIAARAARLTSAPSVLFTWVRWIAPRYVFQMLNRS